MGTQWPKSLCERLHLPGLIQAILEIGLRQNPPMNMLLFSQKTLQTCHYSTNLRCNGALLDR